MTGPVLADACALVSWFADEGATMSAAGQSAMRGEVLISPITVWELTRKASLGDLPPLPHAAGSFAGWLTQQGFAPHPLTWADAERANTLPPLHKDPIDRMLIAQALQAALTVLTEDRLFAPYGSAFYGRKKRSSFLKKRTKKLLPLRRCQPARQPASTQGDISEEQKFFGSFFQKRTPFFPFCYPGLYNFPPRGNQAAPPPPKARPHGPHAPGRPPG